MKITQKVVIGIVAAGTLSLSLPTQAALLYDQNVTPDVIFGSGNGNGAFTVDRQNGIELGLRAKLRGLGIYNSGGNGTYTFQAGSATGWNFEWSINTDYTGSSAYGNLNSLTYTLSGTSFSGFDPIHAINPNYSSVLWDHGIGNNSTANGAGDDDAGRTAASYALLIAANNVAQNSWRERWFGIDPNVNGTYNFTLQAFDGGNLVAETMMTVNVVPEPSTYVAGALLLLPFGASAIRKLRNRRTA